MNCTVVLQYIEEVMLLCDDYIAELTNKFNKVIKDIELLSEKVQDMVYKDLEGKNNAGRVARKYLGQIKPWACSCIRIHTQAFIQREVFAKSE